MILIQFKDLWIKFLMILVQFKDLFLDQILSFIRSIKNFCLKLHMISTNNKAG